VQERLRRPITLAITWVGLLFLLTFVGQNTQAQSRPGIAPDSQILHRAEPAQLGPDFINSKLLIQHQESR
jgi:hypothetical protein